jgi:hypothetical protein
VKVAEQEGGASFVRSSPLNRRGAWKDERKVFPLMLGGCAVLRWNYQVAKLTWLAVG